MSKEQFTIVNINSGHHYDTNDSRFYGPNWEQTHDTKEYLEQLIKNDPDKFENCQIQKTL